MYTSPYIHVCILDVVIPELPRDTSHPRPVLSVHWQLLASEVPYSSSLTAWLITHSSQEFEHYFEICESAAMPEVVSVFPNRPNKLHTTRTWEFLGVANRDDPQSGALWQLAEYGQDIIVGMLDTGVYYGLLGVCRALCVCLQACVSLQAGKLTSSSPCSDMDSLLVNLSH